MKTIISLILTQLVLSSLFSQSTLTVNNNPGFVANGTTTFTELQAAIDYAAIGDKIYIVGSLTTYGNAQIAKQLHIIGEGYRVNLDYGIQQIASVGAISLYPGADNSIIEGLYISTIKSYDDDSSGVLGITLKKNNIYSITIKHQNKTGETPTGWVIKNNIINSISGTYTGSSVIGSVQIINNIITYQINKISSPNSIIEYNLFTRGGGSVFMSTGNVTFSSNIFYTSDVSACNRCSFYNNLLFDPYNQANLTFDYGDNIADDTNLENIDPLFVNIVTPGFAWDNDFHLQSTSPALTAGPNGTEIGIYSEEGSPFGDKPGPDIPLIKELKIDDRMIEPGQQIQIRVKAEN